MLFKVFADITVLVHFLWIAFLALGAIWGVRRRKVKTIHVSGLCFALIIHLLGSPCPLTYLESWLRRSHDPSLGYAGSFIIHYVEQLVYLQVSDFVLLVLTVLLCLFNFWIYFRAWRSHRPKAVKPVKRGFL